MRTMAVPAFLIAFAFPAAQAADVEGSADHPLLPRYEGSEIVKYGTEAFTDFRLMIAKATKYGGIDKNLDATLPLEGKLTRISYRAPEERAVLEVFRNYEDALKGAGFETVFACDRENCGGPNRNRVMLQLDVVELKPMEEKMVVLDAATMNSGLATEGRVAVYGIHFDFDKADIRSDSKPQLDEIAALLKNSAEMKVLIVGHTDGKGGFDYNQALSARRAKSVVDALATGYGIDAKRLTPVGAGMASPVATNRTEEGRAANRRVEIVELF